MIKKCLVVSDSFKGTLSSTEICNIAKDVFAQCCPQCELVCIPMADGGEGTVGCFISAMNAHPVHLTVQGPYGNDTEVYYARYDDCAIIEMASAAGLPAVEGRKNPALTSTYGVGQIIAHAVSSGCREILLGLGGSATNDGGCGCAAALGTIFADKNGTAFVPVGKTLNQIRHIDCSKTKRLLKDVHIRIMSDVTNPLFGKTGAAYVFAPQKGADAEMVQMLDDGLKHLSKIIESEFSVSVANIPGAGAAGGMGAGCIAFLGGSISPGVDAILDITDFDKALEGADLVISGEGRVDSQSAHGKLISGVAARTKQHDVPLIVIAGCIDQGADILYSMGVTAMFTTNRSCLPFENLKVRAGADYKAVLKDVLHTVELHM